MPKKIYSNDLKLEIVKKYLSGNYGFQLLADEYHISSTVIIRGWVENYLQHGEKGLCTTCGTYSGEFKVSVVEYKKETGASLVKTAAHFNIPSKETVRKWEQIYYEQGKEALFEERRGITRKMKNKQSTKDNKVTEIHEDLLAEVKRLRMENEYLKKLNALVQKREKSKKPTK